MTMTKELGAWVLMPSATELRILAVGAKQVVPAHARLARDTRGHDANIGAGDIFILVGAITLPSNPSTGPA